MVILIHLVDMIVQLLIFVSDLQRLFIIIFTIIDYKLFGKSREYYPIIKKTDYFSNHVNGLIKNFFNDSASQFASFFTKETNLTTQELEELKKVIDTQIKNQEK